MKIFCVSTIFVGVVLVVGTGCSSKPEVKEEIPVREFVNVPLYTANSTIPADDGTKYSFPHQVKAYSVGRHVDPKSGTMSEAGTIYRMETVPTWNMVPQYDQNPEAIARSQQHEQYADQLLGHVVRSGFDATSARAISKSNQELLEKQHSEIEQLKEELQRRCDNEKIIIENQKLLKKVIENLEKELKNQKFSRGGGGL